MCVDNIECLTVTIEDVKKTVGSGEGREKLTAESTSYNLKPEFKFVKGVSEGPIYFDDEY